MNLKGFAILLLFFCQRSVAQPAYEIKVTLKPFNSGYLYLAHHFGTKQYLIDSARINEKSEAVFSGTQKLIGGGVHDCFPKEKQLDRVPDR